MFLHLSLVALLALATLVGSSTIEQRANDRVKVNLRIEIANRVIFDKKIETSGHNVTTQSGGTHHCDGTNNGANPLPGPTATSALDDASRQKKFTLDGTFFEQFDDFLVTQIDGNSQTATEAWFLFVNSEFAQVGGCQQRVAQGDDILWSFRSFSDLDVAAPATGRKGGPIAFAATSDSEATGQSVPRASIGRTRTSTGADGKLQSNV